MKRLWNIIKLLHFLSMKLNVHFQGGGKELGIKVTKKLYLFDSYDMEQLLESGILSLMAFNFLS